MNGINDVLLMITYQYQVHCISRLTSAEILHVFLRTSMQIDQWAINKSNTIFKKDLFSNGVLDLLLPC